MKQANHHSNLKNIVIMSIATTDEYMYMYMYYGLLQKPYMYAHVHCTCSSNIHRVLKNWIPNYVQNTCTFKTKNAKFIKVINHLKTYPLFIIYSVLSSLINTDINTYIHTYTYIRTLIYTFLPQLLAIYWCATVNFLW